MHNVARVGTVDEAANEAAAKGAAKAAVAAVASVAAAVQAAGAAGPNVRGRQAPLHPRPLATRSRS